MMDIGTILEMNRERGEVAEEEGREPYAFARKETARLYDGDLSPLKKIPDLGSYVPDGFEFVAKYFVDSSGFGAPGELAMTADEFAKVIARNGPNAFYGIGEVGQFQVHISEFRRVSKTVSKAWPVETHRASRRKAVKEAHGSDYPVFPHD
jgi:hypothetical protein